MKNKLMAALVVLSMFNCSCTNTTHSVDESEQVPVSEVVDAAAMDRLVDAVIGRVKRMVKQTAEGAARIRRIDEKLKAARRGWKSYTDAIRGTIELELSVLREAKEADELLAPLTPASPDDDLLAPLVPARETELACILHLNELRGRKFEAVKRGLPTDCEIFTLESVRACHSALSRSAPDALEKCDGLQVK